MIMSCFCVTIPLRDHIEVCVCEETVDYQEGLLAPVLQKKEEKVIQTEMGEVCVCVCCLLLICSMPISQTGTPTEQISFS